MIVVIVPAHNEADNITACVESLKAQSAPPDRIIVSCDNCTDSTADVARAAGAEAYPTANNTARRSGALNQGLSRVLPELKPRDIVVMLDADTFLEKDFLRNARRLMYSRGYDIVGTVFEGDRTWNPLKQAQYNEYVRYSRMVGRRHGWTLNISGAAMVIRASAARKIIAARVDESSPVAGPEAELFLSSSISEDMELTIAARTLGLRTTAYHACRALTDVMPTVTSLWVQRIRWVQGGFVELKRYGKTAVTRPMYRRRVWSCVMLAFTVLWITYAVWLTSLVGVERFNVAAQPLWLGLLVFFSVERAFTARKAGWRGSVMAALLVPELLYDMFRQSVFIASLIRHARGRSIAWG